MTTTVLDRFRLDGKVAIVTGASAGLVIAFAEALAEAGADLVLTARRSDRLTQTRALVEERGRRALTVTADVARPEDAQTVVDAAGTAVRHTRCARQQSRQGHRRTGHTRNTRAVPRSDRHQSQRVVLDGPGVWPCH